MLYEADSLKRKGETSTSDLEGKGHHKIKTVGLLYHTLALGSTVYKTTGPYILLLHVHL